MNMYTGNHNNMVSPATINMTHFCLIWEIPRPRILSQQNEVPVHNPTLAARWFISVLYQLCPTLFIFWIVEQLSFSFDFHSLMRTLVFNLEAE